MGSPVTYQVIFSGQLRKGYTPEAVKKALTQRLKLSPETVERLFAKGRTVLKQTPSQAQAEQLARQLTAAGLIASIASSTLEEPPSVKVGMPQEKPAATPTSSPPYAPLKRKFLFKPLLYSVVAIESLLMMAYAGLMLALLFGVVGGAVFGDWGSDVLGSAALGSVVQMAAGILGTIVLLILAKPLAALWTTPRHGVIVTARQEPDLYAFIEDICERIGAPVPSEIRLHNEASIHTGYYRGLPGFFRNQPVLMIGMPLIAGMNSSRLAALIAQSLNRYRRAISPRATGVLLAHNQWLLRASNGDDPLEAMIRRQHQEGRLGDALFGLFSKLFSAMNKPVRKRMQLSQTLARPLLHFVVDQGDQAALAFSGSRGFNRLLAQHSLLAFAAQNTLPGLRKQWEQKGELPDNLAQMIAMRSRQYPADAVQKLRERQRREQAANGDLMPSDSRRLERIAAMPPTTLHECISPSASLLRSYAKLAHSMTLRFYHDRLRLPVSPYRLKKLTPKGGPEQRLQQQLDRYFRQHYVDFLPLKLRPCVNGINTTVDATARWQAAMTRIAAEARQATAAWTAVCQAEAAMIDSASAERMHLGGLGMQWEQVQRKGRDLDAIHQQARDDETAYEQAVNQLEKHLQAHAMRLGATLAILDMQTGLSAPFTPLKEEAQLWFSLLERMENVAKPLRELLRDTILLETLLSFSPVKKTQKLIDAIDEQAAECKQQFTAINVALKRTPYPFAGGKTQKLMHYVLQDASEEETPWGHFDRGNDTVKRLALVQRRAVARLTAIGEQVEKAVGLRP